MLRLTLRFFSLAAGFVAVLLAIACSGGIPVQPGGPLGTPDFTVTSKEFVKEFDDNQMTAIDKYKGKVVELTGTITALGYDPDGKPQFSLEGPRPQPPGYWAGCLMADKYPWTKANSGQTVTVKGRGHPIFPRNLVDCEIVKVTGDPAPRMTADEFAKRAEEPLLKDRRREVVVSGEILDKRDPANPTSIYLKCQDKKGVHIHFSPAEYKRLNVASWKPGQKIEVIGGDSSNPGYAWLVDCVPMADPK